MYMACLPACPAGRLRGRPARRAPRGHGDGALPGTLQVKATNTATKRLRRCSSRLFEQLFELFSAGCLLSSKLFELIRAEVIFVVFWWGLIIRPHQLHTMKS